MRLSPYNLFEKSCKIEVNDRVITQINLMNV